MVTRGSKLFPQEHVRAAGFNVVLVCEPSLSKSIISSSIGSRSA